MSEDKEVKPVHGMFAVPAPPAFDFDRTSEWPSWIQLFDDYRFASGLNERSEEAQVRTLLYTMGRQAREIFSTFTLSEQQQKQYETVRKKFDDHFVAARNLVYESACFHRRIQQPGESVDQFVTALHTLADRCDYKEKERMIRDRFVVSLSDAKLSESLQMDANLTLASALAKARLKETVQRQQQQLRETSDEPSAAPASNLDAVNKQRQPRKNSSGQRSGTSSRTSAPVTQGQRTRPQSYRPLTYISCPNCGQGEHPRTSCPARAAKCNYCGCSGHFAVVCRKKSAGERKKVPISSLHMEKGAYFLGAVNGEHSNSRYAQVIINGTPVFAKLDSGAEVSVVPSTFPGLPTKLDKCDITLTGPANEPLHVLGKFLATIQWRQRIVRQTVYVVSPLRSILLGLPALEALELIKFADSVSSATAIEASYPQLFGSLGAMQGEYNIRLKPNSVPFAISVARRIALPLRDRVKQELERMERDDVIRKVDEPTEWYKEFLLCI
ncbi:uncharacterized protein LOC142768344 [Rhipicephalus microplus]|uniref:uncharacterized protein LOC142768344 n=1 Tax=Rhipicephalus microplus TaxID=6941 RepID=UPI003F6D7297